MIIEAGSSIVVVTCGIRLGGGDAERDRVYDSESGASGHTLSAELNRN